MYNICFYFFLFFCYSFFGWVVECINCSILGKRIILDRGFLIGPYCPIYGFGAMYMYIFLNQYYHNPIVLFVMALVGTSIIEYITSFVMEKIFKARWWDYSNQRFNIEGRICLVNSILFGLLGVTFIYLINPFFISLVDKIPQTIFIIISSICFIIFLADNIITYTIMGKLKLNMRGIRKDSTYDIDKQVKEVLSKYKFFFTRLFTAFPKFKVSLPFGDQITSSIRKVLDNIDTSKKERRKKIKILKKEIRHELEKHKKKELKEELKKTKGSK